ncbi:MAG: HAMP domain-containing histidine kinase [Clostridia bacterium]|nr:HAMP domain-containing histidine kinase [Clostridia bacterium]
MKRRDKIASLYGGIIFFITIFVTVTIALVAFKIVTDKTDDTLVVAITMIVVMLFITFVCTTIDYVRRKITVERPVEHILEATEQIASGNFDVRLTITHSYDRYNVYDLIKENVNKMAEELSKSEVLKSDFVSNVSHELKTPLALIQNYTTLIKNPNLSEEKKEEYFAIIQNATKRLTSLVGDILKLNKLENQTLDLVYEEFRLDDLFAETVLKFESVIEEKEIELDCDFEEISLYSVKGYVEIVLSNLISNAIKFTNKGGRVSLSLRGGERAEITVTDTGCGISREVGARIFDKFYQGDSSHHSEGNGLGLALVKKVIDLLGGNISVTSEVGVGSTFKVTLVGVVGGEK